MSDDENLLRELAQHVRNEERTATATRLERLARGELTRDEQSALQAEAARDPKLAEAVRAHQPLAADVKARIAAELAAAARREAGEKGGRNQRARASKGAPRSVLARALWVGPFALAAAALLWIAVDPTPRPELPVYGLEISGEQAEYRAAGARDASSPVRVGPHTRLRLVLRPARAVAGELDAAVFLSVPGAAPVAWPAEVSRAESGALQLVLSPPPAPLTGTAEARVIVGRTELVGDDAPALARGERERGPGFQRLRVQLAPAPAPAH